MIGKKNDNGGGGGSNGQTLNTIIGRGTVFEGSMKVDNSVRVDGIFKGELACTGSLTISQSGEAHANLEAKDVYVNGVVQGTVRAEKVRLDSQARFVGDIHTGALQVAEGAIFHGSSKMEIGDDLKKIQQTNSGQVKALPTKGETKALPTKAAANS